MRRTNDEQSRVKVTETDTERATERWLNSVHITPKYLSDTNIPTEFLIAQREAETLLRNFPSYLSNKQSYQLVEFLKRLRVKKKREMMPLSAAYSVLNIVSNVNRKQFAAHRKLQKIKQDKPLAKKG